MASSKKDFSKLNTGRVYDAITEATADPAEQTEQHPGDRAARMNYTEAQKNEYLQAGKTQGRPGLKAARINMAFTPENYDYIKTMSTVRGQTITEFVNHLVKQSMDENAAIYAQAKAFRKAF